MTGSTLATSAGNYVFSLLLVHLLAPVDYVHYAAAQSLLLILGSGSMAAIPWALAQRVALDPSRTAARQALGFGLVATSVQGAAFAGTAYLVLLPSSGAALAGSAATAAFALSLITAPLGLLQGRGQLRQVAALRIVETAVRLGASVVLLLVVGQKPWLPILGFTAGSLVLLVSSLVAASTALPPIIAYSGDSRDLLSRSARLSVVQLGLASVGVVDAIAVTYTSLTPSASAAYQVAALLGRVPLYLGTAVALAYFPALSALTKDQHVGPALAGGVRLVTLIGLPTAALVASFPAPVLNAVAGLHAADVARVLPATSLSGFAIAVGTVILTGVQARGHYRRASITIIPVSVVQPLLLIAAGRTGSLVVFATAAAVVSVGVLAAALLASQRWRLWSELDGRDAAWLAAAVTAAAGATTTGSSWAWLVVAVCGAGCMRRLLVRAP